MQDQLVRIKSDQAEGGIGGIAEAYIVVMNGGLVHLLESGEKWQNKNENKKIF